MSAAPAHRRGTHAAAHVRTSATGRERVLALDGLRAFALLIIMGYHFGVGWLQGGFFSLDIFYVLSGYLITGLLLGEWARRARIKLAAFWLRRARRLLPALLVVLVVVALVVRFAYPAGLYPDFRMSALSALFYFSNWWQIAASGNYFVATGAIYPLAHTWSLAVEEQFYLVWPLVVVAVMHLGRRFDRGVELLLGVSVVGVAASATEMALLYHPGVDITRLYFGTDTHAQSILVGSVVACSMTMIQRRRGLEGMAPVATSARARVLLTVVGLAGFAGTLALTYSLTGTEGFDYRGGFLLSALSAAAIIVGAVCVAGGPIARVLSLRPIVWIGTVSYGAYLWHYPVFIELDAARTGLGGMGLLAVRFAATFVLAALSYYLVERPVMEGTFWRSLKAVGPAVALTGVTVVVVVATTVAPATAAVDLQTKQAVTEAPHQALQSAGAFTSDPVRFLFVGDSLSVTLAIGLRVDTRSHATGSTSSARACSGATSTTCPPSCPASARRRSRCVPTGRPCGPGRWLSTGRRWWGCSWGAGTRRTRSWTAGSSPSASRRGTGTSRGSSTRRSGSFRRTGPGWSCSPCPTSTRRSRRPTAPPTPRTSRSGPTSGTRSSTRWRPGTRASSPSSTSTGCWTPTGTSSPSSTG